MPLLARMPVGVAVLASSTGILSQYLEHAGLTGKEEEVISTELVVPIKLLFSWESQPEISCMQFEGALSTAVGIAELG